jgi:membrane-bound lytic murein transglycosylase MltF
MSKIKSISNWVIFTTLYIIGFAGFHIYTQQNPPADARVEKLEEELKSYQEELNNLKAQAEQDEALGQYAINMMYQTNAATKISDARKQILARAIVRVSNDVFDTLEHKKAFVAILAIESEFQRNAQSPTGPRGLSQVAKSAFQEGMSNCGIAKFDDSDVWETDINLYAGACYFRALLERHNHDPYIAIVAYNQGPNSKDIKTYSKHGGLQTMEALKYVARFNFLKRTVPETKAKNAVDIKEPIVSISATKETGKE